MPRFHRVKKESDKIPMSDYNLKSDYLEALANMKVTGGKFTISRAGASLDVSNGNNTLVYWAKLLSNLSAPSETGALDGVKTTAHALKINTKEAGLSSEEIIITNRDPEISGTAGDFILVVRVSMDTGYEWQPVKGVTTEITTPPIDQDYPGFSGPCNCWDCQDGPTIPDGTVCCSGVLEWIFSDPFNSGNILLTYRGEDVWASEDIEIGTCDCLEGTCSNIYRWELVPSLTPGNTTLKLLLIEDNGCPKICLEYVGYERWQCKCPNTLTRTIWGNFVPDNQYTKSCRLCIIPAPPPDYAGDYGGQNWSSPVCTLSQEDLPILWRYSGTFTGGVFGWALGTTVGGAPVGAFTNVMTYSGTYLSPVGFIGAVDVWADINILKNIPLIRAGTGSWQTAPITEYCGEAGAVIGEVAPINGEYCPQSGQLVDISDDTPYSERVVSRSTLNIGCSGVSSNDTVDITISLHVPTVLMQPPFWLGDWGAGLNVLVLRYTKKISDVPIADIACEINQSHTLCRDPTYAFENAPCNDFTGNAYALCDNHCVGGPATQCCTEAANNGTSALDPPISDYVVPATVTVSPFGGGPEECPNPGVDEIPPPDPPVDDGGCGGCVPDSGTPNEDTGSCCISGRCFSNMSTALCASFSGEFHNNQVECEDVCIASACCYVDNETAVCVDSITREDCLLLDSDAIWTPFALCVSVDCDIDGACCLPTGTCIQTSEYVCGLSGGSGSTFHAGLSCAEANCPGPGACCFPYGTGVDCSANVTESACAYYGGTWQGEGSDCSACETWGACCHKPSPACTGLCECELVADEADCLAMCSGSQRIFRLGETCSAYVCTNDTGNICAFP